MTDIKSSMSNKWGYDAKTNKQQGLLNSNYLKERWVD